MCDVPISVAFGEKKKTVKIHNLTITAVRQRFNIPDCTQDSNDFGKHYSKNQAILRPTGRDSVDVFSSSV